MALNPSRRNSRDQEEGNLTSLSSRRGRQTEEGLPEERKNRSLAEVMRAERRSEKGEEREEGVEEERVQ